MTSIAASTELRRSSSVPAAVAASSKAACIPPPVPDTIGERSSNEGKENKLRASSAAGSSSSTVRGGKNKNVAPLVPKPPRAILRPSTTPSRRRHKRIMFSPLPEVNEFDINSPTTRRLEAVFSAKRRRLEGIEDVAIKIELGARGVRLGAKSPIEDHHRDILSNKVFEELLEKLETQGIDLVALEGNKEARKREQSELSDMLDLVLQFRRRAELRLMTTSEDGYRRVASINSSDYSNSDNLTAPCEMTTSELSNLLFERKIRVEDNATRSDLVEALEVAMLKEATGLIGDGYEFGRRFVTAEDLLAVEDMNDRQLRVELSSRGLKVPRKKAQKFELLRRVLERDCENRVRQALKMELIEEIGRRNLFSIPQEKQDGDEKNVSEKDREDASSSETEKTSDASSPATATKLLMKRSNAEALSLGLLFVRYFDSGEWEKEAPEPERRQSSCVCS